MEDDDEAPGIDTAPLVGAQQTRSDGAGLTERPELSEQDMQAWLEEVERVMPLLKVHLRTDVKVRLRALSFAEA